MCLGEAGGESLKTYEKEAVVFSFSPYDDEYDSKEKKKEIG